jgi:hypothetical protein
MILGPPFGPALLLPKQVGAPLDAFVEIRLRHPCLALSQVRGAAPAPGFSINAHSPLVAMRPHQKQAKYARPLPNASGSTVWHLLVQAMRA